MLTMQYSTLTVMHDELDALWLRRFLSQKKSLRNHLDYLNKQASISIMFRSEIEMLNSPEGGQMYT